MTKIKIVLGKYMVGVYRHAVYIVICSSYYFKLCTNVFFSLQNHKTVNITTIMQSVVSKKIASYIFYSMCMYSVHDIHYNIIR